MKIGDKVKLINAKGLGKYGFRKGDIGAVNSIANIEGKDMAMYMPEGGMRFYWIEASRLEVVEEEEVAPAE